jgi:hypothetical protein
MSKSSFDVVVAAPMSYAGSYQRIGKVVRSVAVVVSWMTVGVVLLMAWWSLVTVWYFTFGLLLVPYRMMRRGQRKEKKADLRHAEVLGALQEDTPQ